MHWKNISRKAAVGYTNSCMVKIMKIKIHNDVWKVKLVDANAKKMNPDPNSYNFGLTEYKELLISIMDGRSESVTRSTLIHELVHAFLFSYGHMVEGEEAMCDFFGVHGDEIIDLTNQIIERWGDRCLQSKK